MSEIVCDLWVMSDTLRRQWLDDWWQPAKPEPEPQVAKLRFEQKTALTCGLGL